jgi:hypothetical protein
MKRFRNNNNLISTNTLVPGLQSLDAISSKRNKDYLSRNILSCLKARQLPKITVIIKCWASLEGLLLSKDEIALAFKKLLQFIEIHQMHMVL